MGIYEILPFICIKDALSLKTAVVLPYKTYFFYVGYHILWIMYFDDVEEDDRLFYSNIAGLIISSVLCTVFLFLHYQVRTALLFFFLFSGSCFGGFMGAREIKRKNYYPWIVMLVMIVAFLDQAYRMVHYTTLQYIYIYIYI